MTEERGEPRCTRILLVEDDLGDQELTRRGLARDGSGTELRVVSDGNEAMDYLFRHGHFADPLSSPRPSLILLDLNLPGTEGMQILRATKTDAQLRNTPIVVLTTSADERDIAESYRLGCNSYVIKPLGAHEFMKAVQSLCAYWLGLVALPSP